MIIQEIKDLRAKITPGKLESDEDFIWMSKSVEMIDFLLSEVERLEGEVKWYKDNGADELLS